MLGACIVEGFKCSAKGFGLDSTSSEQFAVWGGRNLMSAVLLHNQAGA